jgi:hypothetical protein
MISYCTGLLLPSEPKSVEPIAALTAPARTAAQHQSLLHFVGQGDWSDDAVTERIRTYTIPRIEAHGAISAWIVDDTGFPKKSKHSVGVARQYCGRLGKQDNCQVAVSLSIANDHASLPVAYQLYLPQSWANDDARRKKAGVPEDIEFQTKPQIIVDAVIGIGIYAPVAAATAVTAITSGWAGNVAAPAGRYRRPRRIRHQRALCCPRRNGRIARPDQAHVVTSAPFFCGVSRAQIRWRAGIRIFNSRSGPREYQHLGPK